MKLWGILMGRHWVGLWGSLMTDARMASSWVVSKVALMVGMMAVLTV
jgi:hypothetical protein